MAEFREVMRNWSRMCENFKGCGECPLAKSDVEGTYMCENGITAFDYEAAEPLILRWAADHPEPVYPMWWEWLADKEVVDVALTPDCFGGIITKINPSGKMYEPIPADIAQKLGIEPKEESK